MIWSVAHRRRDMLASSEMKLTAEYTIQSVVVAQRLGHSCCELPLRPVAGGAADRRAEDHPPSPLRTRSLSGLGGGTEADGDIESLQVGSNAGQTLTAPC